MAEISITGMEKTFSQEPGRQGKVDRLVLYQVTGDPGIRFVTVPDEGFSIENAKQAISAFEAQRRLAQPIKFTI